MQKLQEQQITRPSNGSKAVAIDNQKILRKYRLYQLLVLIGGAVSAIGLHFIFAH